ncbi:MAG: bifunctional glutamate N-acetyltransferase/amino-acid acetyltransferase ArgJ [Nitriliruptoraceae bacterium]
MFDHLDMTGLAPIAGGVTAAKGFRAVAATTGVKASGKPDLALISCDTTATVAAVTTTNRTKAPACLITDQNAANGVAVAVLVNSGNANLCTPNASKHAHQMVTATAEALNVAADDVLLMSTGVIGVPLPVEQILKHIPTLPAALSRDGGAAVAQAILTTDSVAKVTAYTLTDTTGSCTIGGIAKGVGMIEPNMATMLAIITTDATIDPTTLKQLLREAVDQTFHCISVDGDTSTSDTVAVLASSKAAATPQVETIKRGLVRVCADLAEAVVRDGEGASRIARIHVSGAASNTDAKALAHSVATSLLVRAALHGADPNWGRVMMALGNAQVAFDPSHVSVRFAGHLVAEAGMAVAFESATVAAAMNTPEVTIAIDLAQGHSEAMMLTCDLTPEYVRFNSEYTT